MADEQTLEIPAEWHAHLDGREGGRLSLERIDQIHDDPYTDYGSQESMRKLARDRADAPYTLVATLPPEQALEHLVELVPLGGWMDADEQRAVGEALSVLPLDAAFEALLERALASSYAEKGADYAARTEKYFGEALLAAMARFPRRAIRVLAPRSLGRNKTSERHRTLLSRAVRRDSEAARDVQFSLQEHARAIVDELLASADVRTADPAALPSVLVTPPWEKTPAKKAKAPPPIPLARLESADRMFWLEGERARWLAKAPPIPEYMRAIEGDDAWKRGLERRLAESAYELPFALLAAPEPMARAVVRIWTPRDKWSLGDLLEPIVARFELDALALARAAVAITPKSMTALLPFGAASLAEPMALALGKPALRDAALAWLVRHAELAALVLIPVALGREKTRARLALEALATLATGAKRTQIEDVTARYGARDALLSRLESVSTDVPIKRKPDLPTFFDPAGLPPPELRDDEGALPSDAVETFGALLAHGKPGKVHSSVATVRRACTPASIGAFSWALFEAWLGAGADPKEKWAFLQLAWLGDDAIAHRLAALMKEWPRQGAHKRAELGLDVLAEMTSDVALVLVHQMAQKARGSLKKNAQKKIRAIAAARALSEEDLADRLVPDLDLDSSGTTLLDYGSRSFRVGFDELLVPYVRDAEGRLLKSLPKPGKSDDAAKAREAEQRFKDLKKNVRTVAQSQIQRFESAMRTERRWKAEDFLRLVVEHPLLAHLARRLVWASHDEGGLVTSFRVAEDRSLAGVHDEAVVLPGEHAIMIAHPISLGAETVARWAELFGDYELLQPFAQLGREVFAPAAGQSREGWLASLADGLVEAGRVIGLESRGWQRGPVGDGGVVASMELALAAGRSIVLELDPGIGIGAIHEAPKQRVRARPHGVRLDDLSPVALSELARDLAGLR